MKRIACGALLLVLVGSGTSATVEVTGAKTAAMAGARVAGGDAVADFLLCPAAASSPVGLGATAWWGVGSLDQLRGSLDAIQTVRRSGSFSPAEMQDLLGTLASGDDAARGEQSIGGAVRLPGVLTGLALSFGNEVSWTVAALDVDTVHVSPDEMEANTSLLVLRGSYLAQAAAAMGAGVGAGPLGEVSVGCQLRYLSGRGLSDTVSVWDATQEGLEWFDLADKSGSASALVLDLGLRLRLGRVAAGAVMSNVNEPWLRWEGAGPSDRRLDRSLVVGVALNGPGGLTIEANSHAEAERTEIGTDGWYAVGAEMPVAGTVAVRAGGRKEQEGESWLFGLGAGAALGPLSADAAVIGRRSDGWRDMGGAFQIGLGL